MRSILRVFPNRFFASLALFGLIAGLVTSKLMLSVATITIMCNAFININAAENFKKWLSDKTNLLFIAVFLIYLLSGFYSSDTGYWVDRCRMKLPFIAIPLGFTAIRTFTKKTFFTWLALYFYTITLASLIVFINYIFHFQEFNQRLSQGQPIPAPLNDHIRFSIEIAFAIITGAYLYLNQYFEKRILKITAAVFILFLIIFIHVFAVRTGIVALYFTVLVLLCRWVIIKKQYLKAFIAVAGIAFIAFLSIQFIPSLHNRMGYFKYELELIRKGELNPDHSDAQRILSMEYGLEIAQKNIFIGTGAGDIKNEMDTLYHQQPGDIKLKSKLPHNQFIYVFAATGIIGLVIFLISLFYPWFSKKRYHNVLYTSFFCIILFSFLTEHTLEIQIGTAFYLLFLLLIKKYIDDTQSEKELTAHA